MKDRKLRVRPSCCKRAFYLFRRADSPVYWIKFTPPRWSFARTKLGKRVIKRSTGTSELAPARDIAERIINSFWKRDESGSTERDGLTAQSEFATIGELLARYESRAKERPRTIQCNANSLRRVVEVVHGTNPESRSTSILKAELIREFERKATANTTSIASYVTQARSVFSLRKMKFYEGLQLPDLTEFRAERVERPEVVDLEPPDLNALRAMDAAAAKLALDDPGSYVAHLLFSRVAMRNIEIWNARETWIVDGRIGLIARPKEGFKPKGRSGWIPMARDVLAEIMRFRHLCVDGYLVPGRNLTERKNAINRRHSRWVKTWIPDKTKTSYELRRYAGSRLLDMGASMIEARDFLRHRNIATTERWYAYRLENRNLPTIGMNDLLPSNVTKMEVA